MSTDIFADDYDAAEHWAQLQGRGEQADREQKLVDQAAVLRGKVEAGSDFLGWARRLPKNMGVGAMDAALNMLDFAEDVIDGAEETPAEKREKLSKEGGAAPDLPFAANLGITMFDHGFRDALRLLRNEIAKDSGTSDTVTQAIAQYAVPFGGWAKAIGGLKGSTLLGTIGRVAAAETATSATALAPHEGRLADLIQMGREMEGKFGEALLAISPDGSLLNQYIDYMTSREDEGEWEGRWKNVVDSLVTTGAGATLVKATPKILKGGQRVLEYAGENVGSAPVGLRAQRGSVGVSRRPYENAPDSLMGFSRHGPQKSFSENKYKHVEFVRVTFPDSGDSFLEAMNGLNRAHTLERARRNWDGAQIESVSRDEVLTADPELVRAVEGFAPARLEDLEYAGENLGPGPQGKPAQVGSVLNKE